MVSEVLREKVEFKKILKEDQVRLTCLPGEHIWGRVKSKCKAWALLSWSRSYWRRKSWSLARGKWSRWVDSRKWGQRTYSRLLAFILRCKAVEGFGTEEWHKPTYFNRIDQFLSRFLSSFSVRREIKRTTFLAQRNLTVTKSHSFSKIHTGSAFQTWKKAFSYNGRLSNTFQVRVLLHLLKIQEEYKDKTSKNKNMALAFDKFYPRWNFFSSKEGFACSFASNFRHRKLSRN